MPPILIRGLPIWPISDVPPLRHMLVQLALLVFSTEMAASLLMFEKGDLPPCLLTPSSSEQRGGLSPSHVRGRLRLCARRLLSRPK